MVATEEQDANIHNEEEGEGKEKRGTFLMGKKEEIHEA
jgi:hypothetical protein